MSIPSGRRSSRFPRSAPAARGCRGHATRAELAPAGKVACATRWSARDDSRSVSEQDRRLRSGARVPPVGGESASSTPSRRDDRNMCGATGGSSTATTCRFAVSATRSAAAKASSERSGPPPTKRGMICSTFNAATALARTFMTCFGAAERQIDAPLEAIRDGRS